MSNLTISYASRSYSLTARCRPHLFTSSTRTNQLRFQPYSTGFPLRNPSFRLPSRGTCIELSLLARHFHSSTVQQHGDITRPEPGTGIKLHFKDSKGQLIKTVEANEGDDILSIAHEHDIDLEGACEGSVACSTCHVILSPEHYDLLPEPEDDENDMLDMAFALTDTSRLGCQVKLTKELDGMTATLPSATRNMFVDGKKSAHH
ncbi:ferredoxin [Artomyces pyxidatus]|uniref:Ferredoxin n=1 Tax=Artomyces pyxidatus TaxID=48021 RepID=A0ACB8SKK9_9AGAM|nr:ferredoxin [Artomyces pyxidatus]